MTQIPPPISSISASSPLPTSLDATQLALLSTAVKQQALYDLTNAIAAVIEGKQDVGNASAAAILAKLGTSLTVADWIYQQTAAGNAYVFSTGLLTITAVLGNLRAVVSNPTGSGKTLYIYSVVFDNSSAVGGFGSVFINPTTTATAAKTMANLNVTLTSVLGVTGSLIGCTADVSATATSGGTAYPTMLYAPPQTRTEFLAGHQLIVLPPGNKIGINVPLAVTVASNVQALVFALAY